MSAGGPPKEFRHFFVEDEQLSASAATELLAMMADAEKGTERLASTAPNVEPVRFRLKAI